MRDLEGTARVVNVECLQVGGRFVCAKPAIGASRFDRIQVEAALPFEALRELFGESGIFLMMKICSSQDWLSRMKSLFIYAVIRASFPLPRTAFSLLGFGRMKRPSFFSIFFGNCVPAGIMRQKASASAVVFKSR